MIYRITYDNKKRKLAHPVKDREELMALRDSKRIWRNLPKRAKVMRKPKQTFCNWPIIWVMWMV